MAEGRCRGLAEEHPASLFQAPNGDGITVGNIVDEHGGPQCRPHTLRQNKVLDGKWDAGEWSDAAVIRECILGIFGGVSSIVSAHGDEGIQSGLELINARQGRIHNFDGREAFGSVRLEQLGCGKLGNIVRHED